METKIEKALLQSGLSIKIDTRSLKITPLQGGKESQIYKVTDKYNISVVVKIPKTNWQKRETYVFKDYLSKLTINTPQFIGEYKDEVLIIEFLDKYKTLNKLSINELNLLQEWIVAKHKQSRRLFQDERRNLSKHVGWMIKEPIKQIVNSKSNSSIKMRLIKLQPKLVFALENVDLPIVLDHSDLEIQNLLFNAKSKDIYVVDWANAIKSPGFFDIAQFKKLANEYSPNNADSLTGKLLHNLDLNKIEDKKLLQYFELIKEIGLLNYYLNTSGNIKKFFNQIKYSKSIIENSLLI